LDPDVSFAVYLNFVFDTTLPILNGKVSKQQLLCNIAQKVALCMFIFTTVLKTAHPIISYIL